ncbi:hypothetical protein [Streptomyces griseorubiginosus]|uniref:hypothetical protein n=1 Tax=Streptomyces griseorubiginosus TaxID=67304 RepID=UPI001AD7DF5B|nr:hypothetical protein [Streptomyces griseorubiginosus]MBO4259584.1 hypothetical protein [Streptomyces griseorubiginosus]
MSGTGPVEPVGPTETGDAHDVIGADAPRLGDQALDRWRALSPRARGAALAAAALTAAGLAAVLLAPGAGPDRAVPAAAPVPFPANVTGWHYLGPVTPPDPRSGLFRFAVRVDSGPPVTLSVVDAAFAGLDARVTPEPAFTVAAGTTRRVTVRISVTDCSGLPLDADLPFLDVTLRNTRAIQHHSFIFDGAYSRDLSAVLHKACDRSPAPLPSRPSGSAGSQNAD